MKLKMTKRAAATAATEHASPDHAGERDSAIPHYGSWGKLASARTLSEVGRLKEELRAGVREGRLAVRIPTGRIDDDVGSDRTEGWTEDPEFQTLLADIERRGQVQPVQVECRALDWLPLGLANDEGAEAAEERPDDPDGVGAMRFALVSGRRRLEACRRLGQPVLATITFSDAPSSGGQLVDRFLENRMRADLTPFERLRSIGELAVAGVAATDAALSGLIGVDRGTISRGRRVFENAALLERMLNVRTATRDDVLDAVAQLDGGQRRAGVSKAAPRRTRGTKTATLTRKVGAATVVARRGSRGVSISLAGGKFDDSTVERALDALVEILAARGVAGGNDDNTKG
jgi:ParB-like chromosome segregation protein Spo0J